MANDQNLKHFTKGDSRINRKGRPKCYDLIHEIARELCCEPADIEEGRIEVTRIEAIFREWLYSSNFQKQLIVIQYAFGKVPDKLELSRDVDTNRIIVEWTETTMDNTDQDDPACLPSLGSTLKGPNLLSPPDEDEDSPYS